MSESKLPKAPPKRPTGALVGMRLSLEGWKSNVMASDPDTDDFMRNLEKVVNWVDELEAQTEPFAKVVPHIPAALEDDKVLYVVSAGAARDLGVAAPKLTAGEFRRLNPQAAKAASELPKPPLDS